MSDKLQIHVIPDPNCPDRMSEVLTAPKNYKSICEELSQAFDVWISIYEDGFPTGQIRKFEGFKK